MSTYKDKYIKYKKKYFSLKYGGSFFDKLGSMASRGGNTVKDVTYTLSSFSSRGDEKIRSVQENHDSLGNDEKVQSVKNIWIASKKGDTKTVMSLINKGADVDQVNKDGATPLYLASKLGRIKTAKFLIDSKADLNKAEKRGYTPLYIASRLGQVKTAELLIDSKADLNKAGKRGYTPLFVASQKDRKDIVSLLIERKADIDKADKIGGTPLLVASQEGNTEIVRLLIKNKVNINKASKEGQTPLLIATYYQHMPIIRILVEAGADLKIREKDTGYTATLLAKDKGYKKIEEYLNKVDHERKIRESMEYYNQRHSRIREYYMMINKLPSKINLIINAAKKLPGIEKISEIKVSSEDLPEVSIKKHISNYVNTIYEIKNYLKKKGRDILIDYLDELKKYNLEPTDSMWPVNSHINMMAERLWNNDIIDDEEFGKIVGEKEAKAKIESLSPYDWEKKKYITDRQG